MNETIAAIATPLGTGGIGIVRISGEQAFAVADRLTRLSAGRTVSEMDGYTCAYARLFDADGEIDQAVVTAFRAPRSYTGEDTVELSVHGGVYICERVLTACCAAGARPAGAGEFTKRAFLNGKLDLTGAEAVADLISARGKQAARAALAARDGALFRAADEVAQALVALAGHLAAWIDYPEEEIADVDPIELERVLADGINKLEHLLATYDTGKVVREGIETVIVGRPNAGKSTLMNLLAGETRSIVTDMAGTTRDVVSDTVRLGDLLLRLSDTAGIRDSIDPVERAGVEMAHERLKRAQLVLAVFDGSDALDDNDRRVISACEGCTAVALVNKNDLPQRLDTTEIEAAFQDVLYLSAQSPDGARLLCEALTRLFALDAFDPAAATVANERQRTAIDGARRTLQEGLEALLAGVSYDAVCVCVENAADALLELTGQKAGQAVVDEVFSRFCVGK